MTDDDKLQDVRTDSVASAVESLTRHMRWAHELRKAEPRRINRVGRLVGVRVLVASLLFFASLPVAATALAGEDWWLLAYAVAVLFLGWSHVRLSSGVSEVVRAPMVTSEDIQAWEVWVAAIAGPEGVPEWAGKALADTQTRRNPGRD